MTCEYDCRECGLHILAFGISDPPASLLCATCALIAELPDDPDDPGHIGLRTRMGDPRYDSI